MGEATGPVSDTRSDEQHRPISRRTDGTGHWLFFDKYRRVAGCSCGFTADIENDAGYDDESMVPHKPFCSTCNPILEPWPCPTVAALSDPTEGDAQ